MNDTRPITQMGKKVDSEFKGVNLSEKELNEIDKNLNKNKYTLKKKIFRLGKMESLTHSDPKLSELYGKMSENKSDRYGYHYNETILNILFNDYVLHSMKYLQKYKNAPDISDKKKSRDKSGINKLEKQGQEKMEKQGIKTDETVLHNNSLEGVPYEEDGNVDEMSGAAGGSGAFSTALDNPNAGKKIEEETTSASSGQYSGPSVWGQGDLMKVNGKTKVKTVPQWRGGTIIQESNYLVDPSGFEKYVEMLNETTLEPHNVYDKTHSGSNKGLGVSLPPLDNDHKKDLKKIADNSMLYVDQDIALMPKQDAKIISRDMTDKNSYFPHPENKNLKDDGIMNSKNITNLKEDIGDDGDLQKFQQILNDLKQHGSINYDLLVQAAEKSGLDLLTVINKVGQARKNQKNMNLVKEETKGDIVTDIDKSEQYGDVKNMNPKDLNLIKHDLAKKRFDSPQLENEGKIDERSVSKAQQKFMGVVHAVQKGDIPATKVTGKAAKAAKEMKPEDVKDFAATKTDNLPEKVKEQKKEKGNNGYHKMVSEISMLDHSETTMSTSGDNQNSMKNKPSQQTSQNVEGGIPTGFQDNSGGGGSSMQESRGIKNNKKNINISEMKELEFYEEELSKIISEMKELKEDKKSSSMVMVDRLKGDNEKNFKADFDHSGTEKIVNDENKVKVPSDDYTQVDNPYELGEKIEKDKIKVSKDKSYENVGNSDNSKGNELLKRNDTKDENHYINMIRGGQQNLVYDNKPDERFEERRKKDMGKDFYQRGEDYKEMVSHQSMYNKDTQPVTDGLEKVQFNKEKSGFGSVDGFIKGKNVSESVVSGKYFDIFNKTKLIDFKLNQAKESKEINKDWVKISFSGMGNKYDNMVNLNEGVENVLNSFNYYIDDKKQIFVVKVDKSINESVDVKKPVINEEFNKMQHLISYDGDKYVNSKIDRKNIK